MAKIKKIIEEGSIQYPATITDAVKNPNNGKTVTQELSELGSYVESPEWIRVITTNDGKILCGIKADGSIEWAIGVPTPVRNYVTEEVSKIVSGGTGTSINDVNKVFEFLSGFSTSDTLASLLETKVNKEHGKSLVDKDVSERISFVEAPEYIDVITDSKGKVLSCRDNKGVLKEKVGMEAPEVCIDGNKSNTIQDPEERIEVKTDAEGKVLSHRDKNGVLHEKVGIKTPSINSDTLSFRQINRVGISNPTTATSIYLEKPRFADFCFYGVLPTDKSDKRSPTTLDFVYKVNGEVLLTSKCNLSIQGHGTINQPKLGYTFDPLNANGDAIEIKWGDMIAVDSFHLKAYFTDRTHARDCGGARVWRNIIMNLPYPFNKVNNKPLDISNGQKVDSFCIADAKYSVDGFPVAFYLNDEFYGLYTLKLKKNRKNYAMQKDNKSEIFLDCLGELEAPGHSAKLQHPFDHAIWEVKNPKLKDYDAGGAIPDAIVEGNIQRLFDFTSNLSTRYSEHEDYIVLPHWICWVIFSELIGNVDVNGNNLELLTWDAIHWSLLPYDFDTTVGLYNRIITTKDNSNPVLNYTFYNTFKACYETEIKQIYTHLRGAHCLDIDVLYNTYISQIDAIPRYIYEQDIKNWPNTYWTNGFPAIEQIYFYLQSRLEYLDSIWLNS